MRSHYLSMGAPAMLFSAVGCCNGFALQNINCQFLHVMYPPHTQSVQTSYLYASSRMSMSRRDDQDDDLSLSQARNDARLDVRNLATQRAIQSFIYLCDSLRDPISVKWIQDFLNTTNQLEYHGTSAAYMAQFGGTWDGPLLEMLDRPKEVVVVSKRRMAHGHHGLRSMPMERRVENPYLEERFVEYNIDIDPVSLASRILAIREQIAKEWVTDLDVISAANDQILESYFKLARDNRKKGATSSRPPLAFERTAATLFNNKATFDATLLRRGNFDLLYNLCTQATVHRLLREAPGGRDKEDVSYQWLSDFYTTHLADFFDGDQEYGRADDFLEEILLSPPSIITKDDGTTGFVDPVALAEQIIKKRNDVVKEWKEIMSRVPQDHADGIRRLIMNKQMEAWGASPLGVDKSSQEGFE